jgi:hypothetical protein
MLTSLISNIQKMTKETKQSYFGKKWSADTAYRKNLDRADYSFDDVSKASPAKQLNDHILTSFQLPTDDAKTTFVNKITTESLDFLAKRQGMRMKQMQIAALLNESMTQLLATMYARIEAYSLELNAYLGCTDLHTVVTRPSPVREVTRFNKARQPLETITYYRARVGTHSWSLVMRGKEGVIEFYLMPVARVMGLSKTEALYEPVATLTAGIEGDQVYWECGDKPLTTLRQEELCMELFSALIQATRDHMEDAAEFEAV